MGQKNVMHLLLCSTGLVLFFTVTAFGFDPVPAPHYAGKRYQAEVPAGFVCHGDQSRFMYAAYSLPRSPQERVRGWRGHCKPEHHLAECDVDHGG